MNTQEVIGEFFRRLAAGDPDQVAAVFADEIDWYVPGPPALPWTGRRSKGSEVADYLRTLWSYIVPQENVDDVHQIVFDGPDAVVLGTFFRKVKSNGRTFTMPVAMHLRVEGDRIVTMHLYEDTLKAFEAFTG